ncbi:MAG: GNAT family N-acetyltransferase [Halobacteriovoraceae bacterium]|nr:GNAT family N-acetyltransferase [Halobacteriovoraceae bacterium]
MYTNRVFTNSISKNLITEVSELDRQFMDYPWSCDALESFFQNKKYRLYASFEGLRLIAFALFDEYDENELHLLKIVTHSGYLKQGLASKLLGMAKKESSKIYLEVRKNNHTANRLYIAQGFKYISTLPKFYSDGQSACIYIYK